jgi:hypothetical protein
VIGPAAFRWSVLIGDIEFERGTRLNEIGEKAFRKCRSLTPFIDLSSVETLGDRRFERCERMARITFENPRS